MIPTLIHTPNRTDIVLGPLITCTEISDENVFTVQYQYMPSMVTCLTCDHTLKIYYKCELKFPWPFRASRMQGYAHSGWKWLGIATNKEK